MILFAALVIKFLELNGFGYLLMSQGEKKIRWLKYGLFLMALWAVFYALFRPVPPPELFNFSDVLGHFLAFFVLCVSGYFALSARASYVFFGLLVLFSSVAENIQEYLSPFRTFSIVDTQANMAGAIFGITLCLLYRRAVLRKRLAST